MSGKRLCIAVLLATMLAAFAVAQDEKNEIGGSLGRTFISDQGIKGATYFDPIIHAGKGLTLQGSYARRFWVMPLYSISAEGLVMWNHDVDLNAGQYGHSVVPSDIRELFVTPAVRVNLFPTTAVSPWVSLGAGFGHISENTQLIYGGVNPGKSKTSFALEGGFGLDVKVWKKLSMRAEVRDFWSGEPDYPLAPTGKTRQHNYFVAGGAFWRF
ncbi:MAG TPA: outer membrane beta-barrel protein [Candidatus Dormibacteraeota bacterium]|nr:outer membrane beta-barrel protein [Candidatus Dormibacteraeota bacterium]